MPNLTHSRPDAPPFPATHPLDPTDERDRLGRAFALLMIPFIVVGYHVGVTVLKLVGRRHG